MGCYRLSDNSTAFGTRETLNCSIDPFHTELNSMISNEQIKIIEQTNTNHQSIDYQLLTTKPEMQFDFLKEKFLIDTDQTTGDTPVDENFDVKKYIYDTETNDDDDDDEGDDEDDEDEDVDVDVDDEDDDEDDTYDNKFKNSNSIDEKLATEHFEDYPSDNFYPSKTDLENLVKEQFASDEFEEANDDLIELYASAISGLSFTSNVISNQSNFNFNQQISNRSNNSSKDDTNDQIKKIELRKQVEDKVKKFKQNSKNRFSQQLNYAQINDSAIELKPKSKDDLACLEISPIKNQEQIIREQDDWFKYGCSNKKIVMMINESDTSDSSNDNDDKKTDKNYDNEFNDLEQNFQSNRNDLRESLNNFSKQLTLLDEPRDRSSSRDEQQTNEQNYQDKLNELSNWSIDTIVRN